MASFTKDQMFLLCQAPLELLMDAAAAVADGRRVFLYQMSAASGASSAFWITADGERVSDAEVHDITDVIFVQVAPGMEDFVDTAVTAMTAAVEAAIEAARARAGAPRDVVDMDDAPSPV